MWAWVLTNPRLLHRVIRDLPPLRGSHDDSSPPLFFLVDQRRGLLLYEPTPANLRWVNLAMAGLAAFWFILFVIEDCEDLAAGTDAGLGTRR